VAALQQRGDTSEVGGFTFEVYTPSTAGALDDEGNVAADPSYELLAKYGCEALPGVDWAHYLLYEWCRKKGRRADEAPPLAALPAELDAHFTAMALPGEKFDPVAYNKRNGDRLLKLCVQRAAMHAALRRAAAPATAARMAAHLLFLLTAVC
jgi:hypothetical protein